MASDLSSECTETIGVLDEKEEGEISLEDVSSSEEGHLNYGYGTKISHCSNCLSTQHNTTWCTIPAKFYPSNGSNKREVDLILQDAVHGKENRHQIKESGCIGTKHTTSTLQEKNDDLVPISSDSDMEIVGLANNSNKFIILSPGRSRVKKKKKKKRNRASTLILNDQVSSSNVDISVKECVSTIKHDITKNNSRSHHREASPIHRSRSKVITRSPPKRHRSLMKSRSPFRRSKSPISRIRSPRRSPRRLKSPKRSPYRSSTKTMSRKTSYAELMPSHSYVNTHNLLKKVRQLGSMGTHSLEETVNKNKDHASSLKEKLTNMMKGVSDNNTDFTNSSKEKSTVHITNKESNDVDDDEDLALLRQKALETKQNKSNKQNDQPKTEIAKSMSVNINDDQDEEDLQLRMIALRSAVLKKHQNRIQKGIKSGKSKKSDTFRSESPFTQSFLDNIPIPGEELLSFASPPHTPPSMNENSHTEDMELDTDVEREKEKLPYSPTDKITANIPIDTELLGIQPSDVSFISLNNTNNSPNFITSSQDDKKSYQEKIIKNQSYLPNIVYYESPQNPLCATNANIQYLSTDLQETSKSDFMKVHNSHLNVHSNEDTCAAVKSNNTSEALDINSNQEMPYSPTDTPIYDPDLSHALPQTLGPPTTSNSSLVSFESYNSDTYEQCNNVSTNQHTQTTKQISNITEDEQLNKAETLSVDPIVGSATNSLMESISPSSSMITIDDLPESSECIPNDVASNNVKEKILEPLYMKGLPDVTKDVNKIPTLINRTLVPASILKTNKQLQLPLPTRKNTLQQEPTFKSAEMQPVVLNEETSIKINTSFKPLKLMSFPQKSHSVLAIPTAFHDFLHEDLTNETSIDKSSDTSLVEYNPNAITQCLIQNNITTSSNTTDDIKTPIQKKKKLPKKVSKRKNNALIAKKHNDINDDVNAVDKQIHKSNQILYTDDKNNKSEIRIQMDKTDCISEASRNIDDERNEISLQTNEEEMQKNNNSSNNTLKQRKNTEDRRQSLDEDEEALRAILLASLPKRAKIAANDTSDSITVTTISTSTESNQEFVNQTVSNTVLSAVNNLSIPHMDSSENDKNQSNAGGEVNNVAEKNLCVENIKTLNTTIGRKKGIPMTKGSQRKLVKRISIPASTKVVNNAKKYQNTMIQKRLNLQKATLYNKQKISENKVQSTVKSNDSKWSTNTKALSDIQRIVINLESDTESDSEFERQKNIAATSTHAVTMEKHQSTINSTAEFEKNLEQFLRAARKKQESLAAARPTSISQIPKQDTILTTKSGKPNSSNLYTPLAVRHLPASQQEEYRRLKQQILEREKLKLHKTIKNKNMEVFSKSTLPNKELYAKVHHMMPSKSQSINIQQLNKENCSKNLVDSIKNTTTASKYNVDKQEHSNLNQSRTNNICTPIESNPNNIGNKTIVNNLQSTNILRKTQTKTKISPLKILSTDEVNEKYVQVQVKSDTNKRVVTINDKVSLNNKAAINCSENISGNKDSDNEKMYNNSINQFSHPAREDSVINNIPFDYSTVDSDASTIVLAEHQRNKENFDTSESTLHLSQCQENTSLTSNTENEHDSHFLSLKNNKSPKDIKSIEENWEEIKKDVKMELNTLLNLSRAEQEKRLMDTEQELVMKRYTILDDLADMSSNLRQWHMERDLQTNLAAEVKKLREQLKVAEERLKVQRNRINNIGPKVVEAHGKINANRQECFKLATICSTLGNRIAGKEYKIPEAGAQLLDNRLKEVANHTRELSQKKVPSIDISDIYDLSTLEEETVPTTSAEISQSESLLRESATIFNEDKLSSKSNEVEKTVQIHLNDVVLSTTGMLNSANNKLPENNIINPTTSEPDSGKKNSRRLEDKFPTKKTLLPYESILIHFKVSRNTNPNGILCPYELMGTCNDGDCQFIHQTGSQTK
ncbi:uncharacterized protein LOC122537005 isoform X2 [Frieseomelitta varia]|uniref:uncharacterized protein LOC122537005 isoform X2 n=1 Tax=Frieseomelitta varia TaxID=561572 RepID=UPI001CB6A18D|nr:uncharacterized protein LOC122537005 isoform X2 [Frieseomelitta varia]